MKAAKHPRKGSYQNVTPEPYESFLSQNHFAGTRSRETRPGTAQGGWGLHPDCGGAVPGPAPQPMQPLHCKGKAGAIWEIQTQHLPITASNLIQSSYENLTNYDIVCKPATNLKKQEGKTTPKGKQTNKKMTKYNSTKNTTK